MKQSMSTLLYKSIEYEYAEKAIFRKNIAPLREGGV